MRFILILLILFPVAVLAAGTSTTFKSGAQQANLVELYTSQGCSSCPSAERWLNAWSEHPDLWKTLVPVAFHVDYWDRLGWADPFASTQYSARQRQYQAFGNINSVYTPGFVVNGLEWKGYYNHKALPKPLRALADISATLDGNNLSITFSTEKESWLLPIELNVAVLGLGIVTEVKAGENARRDLAQEFVALSHSKHASQTGRLQIVLPAYKREGIQRYALAIWANHPISNRVIQAAGGWIP